MFPKSTEKLFQRQLWFVPCVASKTFVLHKSHPDGTGFETWRSNSWYLALEMPAEAIGESVASVAFESPGLKGSCREVEALAPWKEPMRGYLWKCSTAAAEDSSVLEMPVPWDDHQEQQQQWSTGSESVEDKLIYYKQQSWKSESSPWRSPGDRSWVDPRHWKVRVWFCFCLWLGPNIFPSWSKKVF